jgi:hypothetical protein
VIVAKQQQRKHADCKFRTPNPNPKSVSLTHSLLRAKDEIRCGSIECTVAVVQETYHDVLSARTPGSRAEAEGKQRQGSNPATQQSQ